jgi:hypothetical protein
LNPNCFAVSFTDIEDAKTRQRMGLTTWTPLSLRIVFYKASAAAPFGRQAHNPQKAYHLYNYSTHSGSWNWTIVVANHRRLFVFLFRKSIEKGLGIRHACVARTIIAEEIVMVQYSLCFTNNII